TLTAGAAGVVTGLGVAVVAARGATRLRRWEERRKDLETRRATYLTFLKTERAFQTLVFSLKPISRQSYADWQDQWDEAFVAIQLLATPTVRRQVEDLADVFPRLLRVPAQADLAANTKDIRDSYLKLMPKIR